MILHKLDAGSEVGLVEFVGDVPAQGPKLPPLLHSGVQEGHCIECGPPLGQVRVVQLLLRDASIRPLQACFHTLWWLVCELDAGLGNHIAAIP